MITSRLIYSCSILRDQADFFVSGSNVNRVTGLVVGDVSAVLFYNNVQTAWPLVDGTNITDNTITSGFIYFNEIASDPGYYSIRLYPNTVGFWRLSMVWLSGDTSVIKQYDVVPNPNTSSGSGGITATFSR